MSVVARPKSASGLKDLGYLQDIPAVRQLGLLVVVAGAIALGLWLFFWTQKPDYVPLGAGMDAKSVDEASDLLRGAQIPFRIEPGSGMLSVPTDQVGAARMALASAGLQRHVVGLLRPEEQPQAQRDGGGDQGEQPQLAHRGDVLQVAQVAQAVGAFGKRERAHVRSACS
jgi:hypothetical protein